MTEMIGNQGSPTRKDKGYEMVNFYGEEKKQLAGAGSRLLKAAKDGDLEALIESLDKGANIFETDESEQASVLHYATYNDDFEKAIQCTEEILNRVLLNFNTAELNKLIEHQDGLKDTALFWALAKGNHRLIRILVSRGAKLGCTRANETAFHILAKLENHEHALRCAEVLLDAKCYDDDAEKLRNYLNTEELWTNRTALHRAAISGNHELVRLLIANGSDALKMDFVNCNVFHHAAGNAYEDKAVNCIETLMQKNIIEGWSEIKSKLLHSFNVSGKCPIHIAARRGFNRILQLMPDYYLIAEGNTGFTALHACASLGSQKQAEICVRELLESVDSEDKTEMLNSQDQDGCTALYLAAKHKNLEASKLLLLDGSAFDIKSKRGKTPLEKVYEKVPQAVSVLLDKAIKNSGYVAFLGSINTTVELDFGPILGHSSSKYNIFKEAEELAKVCYAKFDDRKEVLNHIFIRVFIHMKWERVKVFFRLFRFLHILWFLYNCFFLVTMYRVECPYKGANAKPYSWTSLRPSEDQLNVTKSLAECEVSPALRLGGSLNLFVTLFYILSQFHQSMQQFHWLFRPMKIFKPKTSYYVKFTKTLGYYLLLTARILPCWPILIATGIVVTTLPSLGLVLLEDTYHYISAGLMGLLIWLAIYLELGKFPKFRVYINLLMRSTRTLLLAIAVTAPILFGFANVFIILIPGEPSFSSASQSFVKVITFMIGELDYEGLFYGEKETVFLGIVMLSLAVFIVIIVVLLVNFLIGLAAEEIRDFWERAEIWKLCTQLEQIVMLESFLDETFTFCGKQFLRKSLMLMPPEKQHERVLKQRRRALIDITSLPKDMQKELHELNLRTIEEVK